MPPSKGSKWSAPPLIRTLALVQSPRRRGYCCLSCSPERSPTLSTETWTTMEPCGFSLRPVSATQPNAGQQAALPRDPASHPDHLCGAISASVTGQQGGGGRYAKLNGQARRPSNSLQWFLTCKSLRDPSVASPGCEVPRVATSFQKVTPSLSTPPTQMQSH